MLQLTILNSIAPKLRFNKQEKLDARHINWFTDGYRTSFSGSNTCRSNTDCESDEICQSGYCGGLKRIVGKHGLYHDTRTILSNNDQLSYLEYTTNDNLFNNNDNMKKVVNQPPKNEYTKDYEHDYDYE